MKMFFRLFSRVDEGKSCFSTWKEAGGELFQINKILTPYAAQVVLLKNMRAEEKNLNDIEISTVDGFQGRETEAIIISMVRSNSKQEVGFLSDAKRMNVAVTRARRQCCLNGVINQDCTILLLNQNG